MSVQGPHRALEPRLEPMMLHGAACCCVVLTQPGFLTRRRCEVSEAGRNRRICDSSLSSCGAVQLFCRPGQRLSLPCPYGFEDEQNLERLTVRWTSPRRKLLCHYIKHRKYQNCSTGYAMRYRPGSIQLSIQWAQNRDLGTHVCSVAKPHESQDFSIHVAWMEESVTSAPAGGGNRPGCSWSFVIIALTCCFVCC
ncbi:uncharacterized protein LOC129352148 isoform X2 [Poeciliopsis prolifica]|uniref:uncharacterized protein LOC129352148 isoform X2 n=1 Tax=Poeciliopsis prolifica TaxID=188132 RepID=UPI002413EFAC|nr:uncharacterized protein LOC129352148 isoform X2 [Poeciliopsis prolifica]